MAFEERKATGRPFVAALATVVLIGNMLVGGVLISHCAQAAAADDEPMPSGDGRYASRTATVPQVTVEARRELQQSVNSFVTNLTHAAAGSGDQPLQLWRQRICFIVAGLPRSRGEFVLSRLSTAAEEAGAPLAQKDTCRPNFYVVATAHPRELLRAWHRHDNTMYSFVGPMPVRNFVSTERPVRVWYNTYLTDTQAAAMNVGAADVTSGAGSNANHATLKEQQIVAGFPSYLEYNAVRDFHSVLVVVDLERVRNLKWGQVADYIAVAGLTRVNPAADFNNTDTILRLFSSYGAPAPTSTTRWDKSFLRALYHTRQEVKGQRVEIAGNMMKDIAPTL